MFRRALYRTLIIILFSLNPSNEVACWLSLTVNLRTAAPPPRREGDGAHDNHTHTHTQHTHPARASGSRSGSRLPDSRLQAKVTPGRFAPQVTALGPMPRCARDLPVDLRFSASWTERSCVHSPFGLPSSSWRAIDRPQASLRCRPSCPTRALASARRRLVACLHAAGRKVTTSSASPEIATLSAREGRPAAHDFSAWAAGASERRQGGHFLSFRAFVSHIALGKSFIHRANTVSTCIISGYNCRSKEKKKKSTRHPPLWKPNFRQERGLAAQRTTAPAPLTLHHGRSQRRQAADGAAARYMAAQLHRASSP